MDSNNWGPSQSDQPPPMDGGDWRTQLQHESRQRIVNKIMETLKRHLPLSGPEGVLELKKIAIRFEEKIYSAATSQSDYLRKISLKMLTMESKSQNTLPLPTTAGGGGGGRNSQDSVPAQNMQSQMVPNQPQQARQQLLPQNIQNNLLSSPAVSGLTQNPMSNITQNQNPHNISTISQNSMGSTIPQGVASNNMLTNAQRQMQGRQHIPQQSQTPQQYMYSQQLQNQMMMKLQSGNIQQSLGQRQQSQSVLQHQQSALRQQPSQTQMPHQQLNSVNMQQSQTIGQQSNISDMQQQRLLGHQNGVPNHQNGVSNMHQHQQQMSHQGINGGLQQLQQQMQSGNQHSVNMIQQHIQSGASLLPNSEQQSQSQQQLMSQIQTQSPQLQQHLGLQQRIQNSNPLLQQQGIIDRQKQLFQAQRAAQEAPSTSSDSTAQTGGAIANTGDWKEDVYQKIKVLKDSYLADLGEMYQKISMRLQQNESLPQQPKTEQLDKLRIFKTMLEKLIAFVQVQKNNVTPSHRDKLSAFEKQIISVLQSQNRPRKPGPSMQQAQMQAQAQAQSQFSQGQSLDGGPHPPMQVSVASMHQNSVSNLQHSSVPSNMDSGQGKNAPSSMQQVAIESVPQLGNMSSLQSQAGVNSLQQNVNPQPDSNMVQNQHLKQQPQAQQLKHLQSRQLQQHILQQQQQQAQFHQQTKQQQVTQMSQLNQTNDANELKSKQGLGGRLSPFVSSPSTPLASSPMPSESEKPSLSNTANLGHQQINGPPPNATQSLSIGTPGMSASPFLKCPSDNATHGTATTTVSGKPSVTEKPIERLLKAVQSISSKALNASVSDIGSVISMVDRIAGSGPGNGSRATVGEDLVAMTHCRLQTRNSITQDEKVGTKRMRRCFDAMPLNVASNVGNMNDSLKQFTVSEMSEFESTSNKKAKTEINNALVEEIREINEHLIDTVVDISDEGVDLSLPSICSEGTVIKCCFSAVSLSPDLKSHYTSALMSPIQPLRLLVPTNYPSCSPILLDKLPVEVGDKYEDLSIKAKSRFNMCLRSLSQPMSLKEIARTWDNCTRAVISEYAQQNGGGTFSSKYGTWENCLTAA